MLWEWHHTEYRTHPGWVPQVTVNELENGSTETVTLSAETDLTVDTRTAARTHNRRLILDYAAGRGWSAQPAANEDEW